MEGFREAARGDDYDYGADVGETDAGDGDEKTIVIKYSNKDKGRSEDTNDDTEEVVVTTHFGLPDNDTDDEADELILKERASEKEKLKSTDSEQRWAGNVKHFMNDLKGKLPGKHGKSKLNLGGKKQRKGRHGAGEMKGMGGSKNLNAAKKILSRMEGSGKNNHHGKRQGKGGKKFSRR